MWATLIQILFNPSAGWQRFSDSAYEEREIFTQLIIPLALAAPVIFLLLIFQPTYEMPVFTGIISCFFIFGIDVTLTQFAAVIYEQLSKSMGGNSSRIQALFLSLSFLSPWFILLALFPIIGLTSLLGFVWGGFLLARGVYVLNVVPTEVCPKFIAGSIFLTMVLLLIANFLFIGFMSVFAA